MAAMAEMKARIVWVHRERGDAGLFYATSPDLPGLLVAEKTLDELERAIPAAIAELPRVFPFARAHPLMDEPISK